MTSQGPVSVKYCQEVVIGWAGGQEGLQRGGSVLTAGSLRFCLSSKTRGGLRSGRWRGTQAKDCLLLSSRNEGRRAGSHVEEPAHIRQYWVLRELRFVKF